MPWKHHNPALGPNHRGVEKSPLCHRACPRGADGVCFRAGGRVQHHQDAMLRSLVAIAWADGHFADEEAEIIEALISTFELGEEDAAKVREYAKTPRSLDDVPV